MKTLEQIAYAHHHDHDFVCDMAPNDEGDEGVVLELCSDDLCCAIRYANGVIRYNTN